MKAQVLDLLACPECAGAPLALEAFSREGEEVVAGVLRCEACRRHYPVIGGVPRLLPDALIGAVARYHPGFFDRYGVAIPGRSVDGESEEQDAIARTLTFYSHARAKLFVPEVRPDLLAYWQQSLRMRIPGAAELGGRLGLDAGCGEGRYTYCLSQWGAEVIGLDLSEAVNLAYRRNRSTPRAHIVQGSIFQPPVRRGVLDFVMSTGVLHHLPDPEGGFRALTPLLRPGGSMRIWVYGLRQMSLVYRLSHLTLLHRLAAGLAPQASYLLSVPLGLSLNLLLFRPLSLLARTARGRALIDPQLRELAALPLQMHIAEVQDRIGVPITHYLTEEELRGWFERASLRGIDIRPTHGGRGWSARGERASVWSGTAV